MSCITEKSFTALSPLCADLIALKLPRCSAFGHPAVVSVMSNLHSLRNLDLSSCANISEDILIALFENAPDLLFMDLPYVQTVTHDVLAVLLRCCPLLLTLNLSGCLVTDLSVLVACRQLETLSIVDCKGISDAALIQLVSLCPTLTFVTAARSGVTAPSIRQTLDTMGCVVLYIPNYIAPFWEN